MAARYVRAMTDSPILLWMRRDLRLADNPMLAEAARTGRPLIPVFVMDAAAANTGAAPLWRWGLSLEQFDKDLRAIGSRMTFRRGPLPEALSEVAKEIGAGAVWFSRLYGGDAQEAEERVRDRLDADGLEVRRFSGHLLFEPEEVSTGTGGFYKVYTPFWKNVGVRDVPRPEPAPTSLRGVNHWPASDDLPDWDVGAGMRRGATVVARHVCVGEQAALERLDRFMEERVEAYAKARDTLPIDGTSGLSENLTYGEIGPRTVWHAGKAALYEGRGDETFLKELVWRDYAHHLLHHTPHMTSESWRPEWKSFPWKDGGEEAELWKKGRTGMDVVDAAMREMYVTGTMHNRGRLIVASYLTKHLMTHWTVGEAWFRDCLIDWDVANNALNWQWVAGSGPDASPFFRVFNPEGQAEKFDRKGEYRCRWIAEGQERPGKLALSYFEAIPESWDLSPTDPYPAPIVSASEGRERALSAYKAWREAS